MRRDLRLGDLPALAEALAAADRVLICFVLDPRLEKSAGDRRLAFLVDSLRELDERLDGRLLVVRGRPDEEIPRLVDAVGASTVHVSEDFSPFGRRRDEAVVAALDDAGDVSWEPVGSPYLVSPGRVTKSDGSPYKVFTPFFRQWRDHGWRTPASTSVTADDLVDPSDLTRSGRIRIPKAPTTTDIPAGENAALARWGEFVAEDLAGYDDDRNRPDLDVTSRMSAYLKFGNIHPRTLAADLTGTGKGAQAYLRELAFRDFYADVLHHWPESAWHNWNRQFDDIDLDTDAAADRRFDAWKQGRTGFPLVDAGMRQLAQTGFMHNRVRMVTASFLVKDLHLPWWWGARWFLDQLLDGDMASNQHGWQWAAGTGTDAAPYFRVFNPEAQAKKFDPDGAYVAQWVPEYGTDDYPEPIVDHKAEREEALRRFGEI
ncbi:cryptochrome/photolyase family protein [Gordonia polyisoprenivorans]|uniref:cryptochrome/photolyase family protein n=1 Tax=Gordonia polyisoprenivorans TaxID=84595 RepID=UPI000B99E58D|nr:deoxyribodipyrimidine photo-lyase [Gordonia polyisoprenivorans]OZC31906.1 deoxyribodipyrimidine photolyase [Gordonia polyisoprenivorans]WCB36447.1 deoxyribodipyrimidine photo-lyase [Gordonia polyisoprenivorans]